MEEAQKEAFQKARLQHWLEEAYQVMTTIHDKVKRLYQKQQMIRLAIECPATKKLVEEVK